MMKQMPPKVIDEIRASGKNPAAVGGDAVITVGEKAGEGTGATLPPEVTGDTKGDVEMPKAAGGVKEKKAENFCGMNCTENQVFGP